MPWERRIFDLVLGGTVRSRVPLRSKCGLDAYTRLVIRLVPRWLVGTGRLPSHARMSHIACAKPELPKTITSVMTDSPLCIVCGRPTSWQCGGCGRVWYCGNPHRDEVSILRLLPVDTRADLFV